MSVSYSEADPWLRVSEEEDRSSDLLPDSRSSLDLDHGLTNLNWLLGFSVSSRHHTEAPQSSSPEGPASTDVPQIPRKAAANRRTKTDHQCPDEVDYRTNPVKPPYTCTNLICMAMEDSDTPKISLAAIYKWITDNFSYFRYAEPTWKNSIRRNLSMNKCFVNVSRQRNKRGKGGSWTIDPRHAERLHRNRHVAPVRINRTFSNQPNITVQPEPTFDLTGVDTRVNLQNNLTESDQDSCSTEPTWPSEETEHLFGSDLSPSLFVSDQKEGQSSSTGPSESDTLLSSAWNEDLSGIYGRPLSPVPVDEDSMAHGNNFSVQVLTDSGEHQEMCESHSSGEGATYDDDLWLESLLQNSWPGVCEMTCLDLLASSAEEMEPLYDFETTIQVQTQTFSQDQKTQFTL